MPNVLRLSRFALILALVAVPLRAAEPEPAAIEFFEKRVRPILVEHCYSCHSADASKIKGGLRVDSRTAILAGGESGVVLVPRQPEKSKFIEAITYKNVDLQMPKNGKLPDAAIADLTAWVKMGAPWPGGTGEPKSVAQSAFDLEQRKRDHWAWKPIREPSLPEVKDAQWPLSPSDRFILAKLEAKGIALAKPAEGGTILRRIYFDLIGLPPAVEEIEDFEREYGAKPQAALERVVDRLLASPQFGERWARHWLDLVRYAESRGHEFDPNIPNAWQYRDYVIRALNADAPYNQFVTEHIAGDLMPKPRLNPEAGFNESILGTGFWFLGEEVHSPVDIRGDEADRFDNRIDVLSKTFLGLTVSCARCHDHKFDAISTKDYYALYGFLRSGNYRLVRFDSIEQDKKVADELAKLRDRFRAQIFKTYADAMKPAINRMADYLMAAREVGPIVAGPDIVAKVDQFARDRKLDAKLLSAWVLHLSQIAKSSDEPFFAWAKMMGDDKAQQAILDSLKKRNFAANIQNGAEIILDYATSRPEDWMPDGPSFGSRPKRPGDVRFSNDPAKPIAKIYDDAATEQDPAFNGLKIAPDSQVDYGALGYMRPGQTIRTPTFPIKSGRVFYLMKGKGHVYASVAGHVLIGGPLHAGLIRSFNAGDKFQWIVHDLKDYVGQRAHLEFTASSPDFAISMVAQGESPPILAAKPAAWLVSLLEKEESPSGIAGKYQQRLMRVGDLLAKDGLREPDDARLAGWMVRHPELFGCDEKANADATKTFLAEQTKLIASIKKESRLALAMQDGSPEDERIFIRGSSKSPGEPAPRRFLQALVGDTAIGSAHGSGRLELARQMTDPAVNPFISRVMVNRVWHHLFGRGIVASTDNFGVMGEKPTHPELLDHLAFAFREQGWSMKKLVRSLVLSRAYQMSSHPNETADAADPENWLLHRMRLRRLEGEAIRDSMLAISGRLNPTMYGPSVLVHLTPFLDGRGRPASGPIDGDGRRSLYIAVRRNFLSPMMLAFDTPSPFSTVGKRSVSNVPAQSLIMMNDPFVHQMAELWGKKLVVMPGTPTERISRMYRQAFARSPTEREIDYCLEYLKGKNDPKSWTELAHVILNVKEFIFLP